MKSSRIFAGHKHRKICVDKYRSFNAVAESFFHLLKRERIRRKTYQTRQQARADVFDYIEFFYNPKRKHGNNEMLSPIEFEKLEKWKSKGV